MSELGEFFNKSRTMLSAERGVGRGETAAGQLEMTGTGQVGPGPHCSLSLSPYLFTQFVMTTTASVPTQPCVPIKKDFKIITRSCQAGTMSTLSTLFFAI